MKKSVKIWLVVAAVLTVVGITLFAGVLAGNNWDFSRFSTDRFETNTYQVTESFESISISVDTTKINFVLTDEDTCSIVCRESEKVKHSVAVQNGTLMIETVDSRKWYDHIGIFVDSPQMTVYLPKTAYTSLFIETDTGDIKITSVTVSNDIDIETDTGNVVLETVTCAVLDAESDTGDISLKNATATERLSIETQTGNVIFDHSDAGQIFVGTSTGDVTGSLLSEKVFITQTATGKVNVPKTTSGGECQITTDTGDIKITIDP